ncbi:MAG: type IV pilus modification protein PilV [Pseudomonadales bacterium]|nr:type IV pilus modification protein PilV [Pseudomonadales bacterium]
MSISFRFINSGPTKSAGFSMVELLVSLIIFSIGLLGAVSLQITGMKNNQSAYLRSQASSLASEMADRIRSNSTAALAGGYDDFTTTATSPADPACTSTTTGCTGVQQATTDVREWSTNFKDVAGNTTNYVAIFPGGFGTITRANTDQFAVIVSWSETDWKTDNGSIIRDVDNQTLELNFRL